MSEYKDGRGDYYLAAGMRELRERPLTEAIERPPATAPGKRLLNMLADYSGKGRRWRAEVQRYADVIREVEARDPCAIYPEDEA